jgi:hypothetical protein
MLHEKKFVVYSLPHTGNQIKNVAMDLALARKQTGNMYRTVVGSPLRQQPLGRLWRHWEYITEINLQELGC